MKNKLRIGIDVDGVLRDFEGRIIQLLRKKGMNVHRSDDYSACMKYEVDGETVARKIWGTGEFLIPVMEQAPVIPGALEAYNMFCNDSDFEVFIVTAQQKISQEPTHNWLMNNGFDKHVKTFYFRDKLLAPCQVLIDDRFENVMDYQGNGRMGIMINHKYNHKHLDRVRHIVDNLQDAYKLLKEMK